MIDKKFKKVILEFIEDYIDNYDFCTETGPSPLIDSVKLVKLLMKHDLEYTENDLATIEEFLEESNDAAVNSVIANKSCDVFNELRAIIHSSF